MDKQLEFQFKEKENKIDFTKMYYNILADEVLFGSEDFKPIMKKLNDFFSNIYFDEYTDFEREIREHIFKDKYSL
jgi:hypothetical protein